MPELPAYQSDLRRRHVNFLCDAIFQAFPPEPYLGPVLAGGDTLPTQHLSLQNQPALQQQQEILDTLKGQRWTHIPASFLEHHLGDFILLTSEAFAAFLPAWLLFALDNDNRGGEFVAYTFAPGEATPLAPTPAANHATTQAPSQIQIRPLTIEMFRALTPLQRRALRDFLIYLSEHHDSDFIADRSAAAVDTVANLITVFESESL